MASLDENVRKIGHDIFVASTQAEIVTQAPVSFLAKQAERHFYGTERVESSRKTRFQEYLDECEVENNF